MDSTVNPTLCFEVKTDVSSDECNQKECSSSSVDSCPPSNVDSSLKFEDISIKEEKVADFSHVLPIGLDNEFLGDEVTGLCKEEMASDEKRSIAELNVHDPLLIEQPKEFLLSLLKKSAEKEKRLENLCQDLKSEMQILLADQSKYSYEAQLEDLKNQLAQAKNDLLSLKNENALNIEKIVKGSNMIKEDLMSRITNCKKQYEAANRDKEDMVVKYAMAEKEVIIVRRQKENVEKKVKELERDKDILQGKLKTLSAERSRICNTLDNKIQENGIASRTIDKLKEEINAKDVKIKWSQSRLLNEIDAHKESLTKLDKALYMITNHEEEIRIIREEAEKMVRETKQAECTRENILEKHLQETKAKLIMTSQKYEDLSQIYNELKTESETLLRSHLAMKIGAVLDENVSKNDAEERNCEKVSSEPETNELSEQMKNINICLRKWETEKLRADLAEQSLTELERKSEEQNFEMEKCRAKESELLSFTQKLTDKNVILQSQLTSVQGKVRLFELEHSEIKSELDNLKLVNVELQKNLKESLVSRNEVELRLKTNLNERNEEVNNLKTKVSDLLNEVHVLNKKHVNYTKDSAREIQKLRKKLDTFECQSINPLVNGEHSISNYECTSKSVRNGDARDKNASPIVSQEYLSPDSRTSSDTSLNTLESISTNGNGTALSQGPSIVSPIDDLTQDVLISRIIKLQKIIVKKTEKCEFLEEHVQQLLTELKKKSKIINHYILNAQTGALSNAKSDSTKASIMKHGGIMASIYGSSLKDETMTLELSLEINKKLQSVLEDTLLKNITFKENLSTLGDEVAKLTLRHTQTLGKS